MRKMILLVVLAALSAKASLAQTEQEQTLAKAAYCKFVTEQASAQRDLLRTPNAIFGPMQPNTGTPPQLVMGVETSISDLRKAKLTMEEAKTSCALYDVATDAKEHVYYALPSIEKFVLKNRLRLIQEATDKLDEMIAANMKLVDAQNLSRPAAYSLKSAKVRLDMTRTAALTGIASPYVPPLSGVPLYTLIGQKQTAEIANQAAASHLQKQSSWDIKLSGGTHRQIYIGDSTRKPFGAYGEFSLTYNLGRSAENKHLDKADAAYGEWKQHQFDDVIQQAVVLELQIHDTLKVQQEQLAVLTQHSKELDDELIAIQSAESSNAASYRNQLLSDQLVLQVDVKDVQYRMSLLRDYLRYNFNEE